MTTDSPPALNINPIRERARAASVAVNEQLAKGGFAPFSEKEKVAYADGYVEGARAEATPADSTAFTRMVAFFAAEGLPYEVYAADEKDGPIIGLDNSAALFNQDGTFLRWSNH